MSDVPTTLREGLNALLATVTTTHGAPVIVGQRLRKVLAAHRGAQWLVRDALATIGTLRSSAAAESVLLRADSAFYGAPTIGARRCAPASGPQRWVDQRPEPVQVICRDLPLSA